MRGSASSFSNLLSKSDESDFFEFSLSELRVVGLLRRRFISDGVVEVVLSFEFKSFVGVVALFFLVTDFIFLAKFEI